jgi:hypothetical protein
VRLKILDKVFLPRPEVDVVDIYYFGLGPDCSREPVPESRAAGVTIGARFKFVARELLADGESPTTTTRLDGSEWTGALTIPKRNADFSIEREFRADYVRHNGFDGPSDFFELRRDMARLHFSKSDAEASEVLGRLINNHWFLATTVRSEPSPGLFLELLHRYVRDPARIADFERRRKVEFFFSPNTSREEKLEVAQQFADNGDLEFQYQLGEIHRRNGRVDDAAMWYRRASSRGFVPADLALAELHLEMAKTAASANIKRKNLALAKASKRLAERRIRTSRVELLNSRTRCVAYCTGVKP